MSHLVIKVRRSVLEGLADVVVFHLSADMWTIWFCLAIAGICLAGGPSIQADPIRVGSEKQLFLGPWAEDGRDDYLVESMHGVTMTMNETHVTGEQMIRHDKPWDRGDVWLSVLKDRDQEGEVFRMYYGSRKSTEALRRGDPYSIILLYAESRDGIHWNRPNLRLWEWEGSRDNNILFPNDDFPYVFKSVVPDQVFIDPNASSPDEKYKMVIGHLTPPQTPEEDDPRVPARKPSGFLFPRKGTEAEPLPPGHHVFASADAIHWKLISHEGIATGAADAKYSVAWDARLGKYVQFSRVKPPDPEGAAFYRERFGVDRPDLNVRMIGRAESDDLLRWGKGQIVIRPDEQDRANSPAGLTRLDFYGPNVRQYGDGASAYIALPTCHSHWKYTHVGEGQAASYPQTIDVQLATSRDGIHWNRAPGRKPFIRHGVEGAFWSKQIYPSGDIIPVGGELWFYFGGAAVTHGANASILERAIGRAVLRLDGFISADAAYTGGELVTRPLMFTGNRLQLNVATGAGGSVQVEIQDVAGKPIPGFALEDADEINGNYLRVAARWRAEVVQKMRRAEGNPDVGILAGRPVRLRFIMRDAKLYSFQFVPSPDMAGPRAGSANQHHF